MAKDSKKNVTAWLDEERLSKLAYIIEKIGGNPSNSYVLSKLIDAEYERLISPASKSISLESKALIRLMLALVKGNINTDEASAVAFFNSIVEKEI